MTKDRPFNSPMKRSALVRRTPLRRVSFRRLQQLRLYWVRRARFLRAHPYCQLWLKEHGVDEAEAIRQRGCLRLGAPRRLVFVPRSATVHHRNKRRGARLLDEREWRAVGWSGHRAIEDHKAWARGRGFLKPF